MGAFYGSVLINGLTTQHVVDLLSGAKRNAFVLEVSESQCLIWDQAMQGFDDVEQAAYLARAFSRISGSYVVTAINQDDDVLGLSLYAGGEEVDFYLSRTDFEDLTEDVSGDAAAWCNVMNMPWLEQQVKALFAADDFTFENERHEKLAKLFGWPAEAIGVNYTDLEAGYPPDSVSHDQFIRVVG